MTSRSSVYTPLGKGRRLGSSGRANFSINEYELDQDQWRQGFATIPKPFPCWPVVARLARDGRGRSEHALESAVHLHQGRAERSGEGLAFGRRELAGDRDMLAARDEPEALQAELVVGLAAELRPQRIEAPFAPLAAMADATQQELERGQHHLLEGAAGAGVGRDGDTEGDEPEAEEACDRPQAEHQEGDARRCPGEAAERHDGAKAVAVERPVRLDHRREDRAVGEVEGSL